MKEGDPSLYEESITRRGQHVIWYSSNACFCTSDNGRINPNCPKCFGKGFVYFPVTSARRIVWGVTGNQATINVANKGSVIKSINKVLLNKNDEVTVESFTVDSFTLSESPAKGVRWTLDYEHDFERAYSGVCTYLGKGFLQVPVQIENVNGVFPGSITEIFEIRNITQSTIIPVINYWGNQVLVSAALINEGDKLEIDCSYVNSVIFLFSGVNPKARVQDNLILQQADAQMTFPGTFHVGRGDVIVCLTAETKDSAVGINNGASSYKLPYFRVSRILKIEDRYGVIEDFTLVRGNEIVWGDRKPERFSITFTYNPAFSVLDELPNLRYSEDKIFPKKVFLKKFAAFNHADKILKFINSDDEDLGILDSPKEIEEAGGLI